MAINTGLKMYMQSAIAAAKTISAATNAAPGVFTSNAHGYIDGDYILLEVQGMNEVNKTIQRVYGADTNTFKLDSSSGAAGVDTTDFGVFISGTAKKITYGTEITSCKSFSASGGEPTFAPTTTIHDMDETQQINGSSPVTYNLVMKWNPADASQQAMKAAYKALLERGFMIKWRSGEMVLFYGSVGYAGTVGGEFKQEATSPASLALGGKVTELVELAA